MRDPGLYTDSTGEGMAGATDVRLSIQRRLGTDYGHRCPSCGRNMMPQEMLLQELCPTCDRRAKSKRVNGGMA